MDHTPLTGRAGGVPDRQTLKCVGRCPASKLWCGRAVQRDAPFTSVQAVNEAKWGLFVNSFCILKLFLAYHTFQIDEKVMR